MQISSSSLVDFPKSRELLGPQYLYPERVKPLFKAKRATLPCEY